METEKYTWVWKGTQQLKDKVSYSNFMFVAENQRKVSGKARELQQKALDKLSDWLNSKSALGGLNLKFILKNDKFELVSIK